MRTITRAVAALVVVGLLLAACSDDDTATTTSTTAGDPARTTTDDTTTTTATAVSTVSVYFMADEALRVGHGRQVEGLGVAAAAVEHLLAGPDADDAALGLGTAIPEGTTLLSLNIVDDLATVDLSGEFESGGGTLSMNARLAQVVYTVTQFPSVRRVAFRIDGVDVTSLGGEGLVIDRPLTRADFEFGGDFEHVTPPILVETPRPGEAVEESIRLTGRANTFEATFGFEVVDDEGAVVVEEGFGTATSGSGTPGDFDVTIPLPDEVPDRLVLLVFERSPADGERTGLVEVPLVGG